MEKFKIKASTNPFETTIERNGDSMKSVTRFRLEQSIRSKLPELVLWMTPQLIEADVETQPIIRFDRPAGYDPYNSAAA